MLFLVIGFAVWAVCLILLVGVCGLASHPPARGLFRRPNSPNPPSRL